jgi:HEAT repeat protein
VRVCGNRRNYIHALLDLEALRNPTAMLALGATDGSLLGRARRLLRQPDTRADAPKLAASAIVLAVVCGVGVLSFVSVEPADASLAAVPEVEQSGKSTPVVMSPDPSGTLESRWAWAEQAARHDRRARYWIGYRISPVQGLPPFVYFDRDSQILASGISFSGHTLSRELTGLRIPGRPLALSGSDTGLKVLFGFDTDRGTPMLTAVHVSTLSLPVDLRSQPVFWLGAAESSQSLELLDKLYARARTIDLKDDLVAAVGVHDASPAVVGWLTARVDSGDPDEVRANAAERIAWHPIRESIGVLDRIARADRASKVRQEAAEALGDLALPDAAPALIALARELQDEQARLEAVEALGARSESIAHDALAQIAQQDPSLQVQREAVETLGESDDPRAAERLSELARTHADEHVRAEAVETLGETKSDVASVWLLKSIALGDLSTVVQQEAIETLADLKDGAGIAALVELAREHPSEDMRKQAIEALVESDHPKARELFDRALGRNPRR